jgi:hypothetical protein
MSAVLSVPVINPIFKTLLHDPEFKNSLKELMITLVKEDQEFRECLMNVMECFVQESIHKFPKRLAVIEKTLGLNDWSDFDDEDHELTLPEQLSLLAERIDNITEPVACQEPIKEPVASPKTLTETRACLLVDHLRNRISPRNGVFLIFP